MLEHLLPAGTGRDEPSVPLQRAPEVLPPSHGAAAIVLSPLTTKVYAHYNIILFNAHKPPILNSQHQVSTLDGGEQVSVAFYLSLLIYSAKWEGERV